MPALCLFLVLSLAVARAAIGPLLVTAAAALAWGCLVEAAGREPPGITTTDSPVNGTSATVFRLTDCP
jgi:hypothetical protein